MPKYFDDPEDFELDDYDDLIESLDQDDEDDLIGALDDDDLALLAPPKLARKPVASGTEKSRKIKKE